MAGFLHDLVVYDSDGALVAAGDAVVRETLAAGGHALLLLPDAATRAIAGRAGARADRIGVLDLAPDATVAELLDEVDAFARARADDGRRGCVVADAAWARKGNRDTGEQARVEAWLHRGFHDAPLHYRCAYDRRTAAPEALTAAYATHPMVDGRPNPRHRGRHALDWPACVPDRPAPEAAGAFAHPDEARHLLAGWLTAIGVSRSRMRDMLLGVNEVVTNAIRHGGGHAAVRGWREADDLVVEVRDADGPPFDPMRGYRRPGELAGRGWGLWLARQSARRVEVSSGTGANVVRLRFGGAPPPTPPGPARVRLRCSACGTQFTTVLSTRVVEAIARCGECGEPALVPVGDTA